MPQNFRLWLSILLTALLSACATVVPTCGGNFGPATHDLAGTQWELIRWHLAKNEQGQIRQRSLSATDKSTPLSLTFSPDGKVASGFSGCNLYNGLITSEDKGPQISKIALTKKSCSAYAEELEQRYLSYLSDYRTMVRDGDRLIIMARDGEVLSFALRTR